MPRVPDPVFVMPPLLADEVEPEALDARTVPEADRRDGPAGDPAADRGDELAAEHAKRYGWGDEAAE